VFRRRLPVKCDNERRFLPRTVYGVSTTEKSAHPTKRDAPLCSPKTPVSTPLHLPLSTRLGEISLSLGVPSNKQAIFWPIWRSWCPQRPSAAQPPRPNFLKGAPTGRGWRPPRAGRPPLSRRPPPLGRPSRAAGAPREAVSTRAPPRSFYCRPGGESPRKATALCLGNSCRLSSTKPPQPFPLRSKPKGHSIDQAACNQGAERGGRTAFRFGERSSS
jgi:hypothetical protein